MALSTPRSSQMQLAEALRDALRQLDENPLSLGHFAAPMESRREQQGNHHPDQPNVSPPWTNESSVSYVAPKIFTQRPSPMTTHWRTTHADTLATVLKPWDAGCRIKNEERPMFDRRYENVLPFKKCINMTSVASHESRLPCFVLPSPKLPAIASTESLKPMASGFILHRILYTWKPSHSNPSTAPLLRQTRKHLEQSPTALLRYASFLQTRRNVYSPVTRQITARDVKSQYHYPLHLALANAHVPVDILQSLVSTAAELERRGQLSALILTDGPNQETPLMVLLKHRPHLTKVLDEIILSAPVSVAWTDRQQNSALHYAVRYGASAVAVRHLVIVEPKICLVRNRLGQTALDIAQTKGDIDSGVLNFLSARTYRFQQKARR